MSYDIVVNITIRSIDVINTYNSVVNHLTVADRVSPEMSLLDAATIAVNLSEIVDRTFNPR
jgi:hypothetical protein